jgi:hypothetical protein
MEVVDLAVGGRAHFFDEEQNNALKNEDDEQDDDDLGELVLKKEDDAVMPVMFYDLNDALILRGHGQKVHDYCVSLSGCYDQNASGVRKMQFGGRVRVNVVGGSETMMKLLRVVMVGLILTTLGSVKLSGGQMLPQQPAIQPPIQPPGGRQAPGFPPLGHDSPLDPNDPLGPHREEQQAQLRNSDRQKRLVADTDKLLVLATDLKAQVDKSTKDTLSVDVIKKADEIEKLAHSLKERMKG